MNYLKKYNWKLSLPQRIGIFLVLIGLVVVELVVNNAENFGTKTNDLNKVVQLEEELAVLITNYELRNYSSSNYASKFVSSKDSIKPFNPNDLTKQGWEKLGFSPKQAEVIMKYKQILGGKFESKEQIKKCFVISDEIYEVLEPKILLPSKSKSDLKQEKSQLSKKIKYVKFNPNDLTEKDWEKLGFSARQAAAILKYKNILGGEFKSKAHMKKCFVISDEKYQEMESYIDLPDKLDKNEFQKVMEDKNIIPTENKTIQKTEVLEKFNPNSLEKEDWVKLGFSEKQAQTILNFKKSLGGKFKDAKTLKKCFVISEEKFNELEPHLVFD